MGNKTTKGNNNYSELDPNKNYCLKCFHCNSDKIRISLGMRGNYVRYLYVVE